MNRMGEFTEARMKLLREEAFFYPQAIKMFKEVNL